MKGVYYNEFNPYAAQWLRNLIAGGHIAAGDVDERSIVDVQPDDLRAYPQCHFFAGIGGWSYALRIAGWDDAEHVWTGSCPCQPLSGAGQRRGHADERHLWPAFYRLIAERAPAMVFGEQVASADGREWLAGVRADLEGLGYAVGAADLCAASTGAPHIRQRLYWVAHADGGHAGDGGLQRGGEHGQQPQDGGGADGMDHAAGSRRAPARGGQSKQPEGRQRLPSMGCKDASRLVNAASEGRHAPGRASETMGESGQAQPRGPGDDLARVGHAASARLQGQWREYRPSGDRHSGLVGFAMQAGVPQWNGPTVAVQCSDGARRVSAQSNSFPLATGVSGRMGRLRAYGNAIVPQVAAAFIVASAARVLSASEMKGVNP